MTQTLLRIRPTRGLAKAWSTCRRNPPYSANLPSNRTFGLSPRLCRFPEKSKTNSWARRRLEITRALVLSPKFLLLDEPFSGVDPISVSEVTKIIFSLKERGIGVFLTDHNVRETLRAVDRAYLLYDGKVLAHGDSSFLLSDPETREKYLGEDFEE